MSDTATVLFAVVGGIAGAAWFLAVVEWIGTLRLCPLVFRTGIAVFRETNALPPSAVRAGSGFETQSACCRLAGPTLCLFRFRVRLFGFSLHTPFLVKGSIRWEGASASVTGRIPLFPMVFLAAWLLGCTAGGVMLMLESETFWVGVGLLALGWVFPLGLCLFSIPFEVSRAREALDELRDVLGDQDSRHP